MSEAILTLRKFGVAFGTHRVLTDVDLDVPASGVTTLLGPVSVGKSTLLRTLAGFNDAQPSLHVSGRAEFAGGPLGRGERPALVLQKARLLLDSIYENLLAGLSERRTMSRPELLSLALRLLDRASLGELANRLDEEVLGLPLVTQRLLAIVRTTASNPKLLCLDEPTADLPDADAERVLQLIADEARRRAILFVTHNQEHARRLGGRVALLVEGTVVESGSAARFFSEPQTALGRQFLRTGSCSPPAVDADERGPASPVTPVPEGFVREAFGPRGFHWLKNGLLAGTPRPGILDDVSYDLEALARVGIKVLVSLEEEPFDPDLLQEFGIMGIFVPIADMGVPTVEATCSLCRRVEDFMREGRPVAFHCRAGLGRTGTLLACQLIWEGMPPNQALERVRQVEPRWVQSEAQVEHLRDFGEAVARALRPPG